MNVQIAMSMFDGAGGQMNVYSYRAKGSIHQCIYWIDRGISDKWKFSLWILDTTLFLALGLVEADSLHKIVYPKNFA